MYHLPKIKIVGLRCRICGMEQDMATKPDELLPTAKDFMQKLALAEAEEASKEAAKQSRLGDAG